MFKELTDSLPAARLLVLGNGTRWFPLKMGSASWASRSGARQGIPSSGGLRRVHGRVQCSPESAPNHLWREFRYDDAGLKWCRAIDQAKCNRKRSISHKPAPVKDFMRPLRFMAARAMTVPLVVAGPLSYMFDFAPTPVLEAEATFLYFSAGPTAPGTPISVAARRLRRLAWTPSPPEAASPMVHGNSISIP